MTPRIRTIKPEFFEDEKINQIKVGARYTAIGLMSMADDRGRLKCMLPAVRTFVFPAGDISERQFAVALDEVLGIGFAWRYEVDPWAYLWLPRFWRHQRINRPSESSLPPHPRDPYGGLPISEAMAQCKADSENGHVPSIDESVNDHGGLTPSRAGVRSSSLPFPVVAVSSSNNQNGPTREPAPARGDGSPPRSRRRVDQTVAPASFPEPLKLILEQTMPIVEAIQAERGGTVPTIRGVALAIEAYPDRDHMSAVRELQRWALVGGGRDKLVKDWVRTFATFLERSSAGSQPRAGTGEAISGGTDYSRYDRAAGLIP